MAVLKCKMCAGDLQINEGSSIAVCEYCGTKQTLPRFEGFEELALYNKATQLRQNNNYDEAKVLCEQYIQQNPNDADAYWNLVLCNYGVEYVEDPKSKKRIPTVNRTQLKSIFDDPNYKMAIKRASSTSKEIYESQAKIIDEIQKNILQISKKEKPFDIFICYKETDENGKRTQDSVIATDLYYQLTKSGYKVFFARVTLEEKLGSAYEPYIFSALNSAKVMIALGTKPEYFNAVWVKNEWSRFLYLAENNSKKVLIPAYRDMDAYDLPKEFSNLQAQDMSKLGFVQDLAHGIRKIVKPSKSKGLKTFIAILAALCVLVGAIIFAFNLIKSENEAKPNDTSKPTTSVETSINNNSQHITDLQVSDTSIKVQSITLNPNGNGRKLKMFKGCSHQFSTVILPKEASTNDLVWTSTNPTVATVNESGEVIAVSGGETTIIVSSKDGSVSIEQPIIVFDVVDGFSISNDKSEWKIDYDDAFNDETYFETNYEIPFSVLTDQGVVNTDSYIMYDYSIEVSGEYVEDADINDNNKHISFTDAGGNSGSVTIKIKATLSDLWLSDTTFLDLENVDREITTEIIVELN